MRRYELAVRSEILIDFSFTYSTYSAALESFFPELGMVAGGLGRRVVTECSASLDTRVANIRLVTCIRGLAVDIRETDCCLIVGEHKVNNPVNQFLVAIS